MDDVQKSASQKAFFISLIYVGVGTLCLLSMYADSPLYGDWAFFGALITLPVTFASFGLLYMEPERFGLALLIQAIMFFVMWYLVYRSLNKTK
ncbi:hypothetical protein I2I11_12830 [Pontibacter sp. 172403-2]|uniref:hypothetical protein n=1 Tax=Pontibacter rufus TaxID=2791028 RepID=UPI0018AF61B8|nr:hypothetical protein [Pontibacter sp. 172403-2]MBF9254182.1 hypothetical protein [Pontibacter sp. 172403-2]